MREEEEEGTCCMQSPRKPILLCVVFMCLIGHLACELGLCYFSVEQFCKDASSMVDATILIEPTDRHLYRQTDRQSCVAEPAAK